MDDFVTLGSNQACNILKQVGASSYESTCVGYRNTDAYYQAGLVFWGVTGLALVVVLILIRKSIGSAFS